MQREAEVAIMLSIQARKLILFLLLILVLGWGVRWWRGRIVSEDADIMQPPAAEHSPGGMPPIDPPEE